VSLVGWPFFLDSNKNSELSLNSENWVITRVQHGKGYMNLSNLQHGSCERSFARKSRLRLAVFFGVPLGTGSEVRANILMYVDPRR
jgi:hypothetical protein